MLLKVLLVAVILLMTYKAADTMGSRRQRCHYERSHSMSAVNCHGLNLPSVPTNFRSDIQVMDMSFNRIRELYNTTFTNYGYLILLYLQDNMIMYIENGTFDSLTELEVVDLSSNSLIEIPSAILKLPGLRKLYVDNNRLTQTDSLLHAPVSLSLHFLSFVRCHLKGFPPLNKFPYLYTLNLSSNELTTVSPDDLAPLCSLHVLDVTDNPHLFHSSKDIDWCDCSLLHSWITSREITMELNQLLNCSATVIGGNLMDHSSCPNVTTLVDATEMYSSCKSSVQERLRLVESKKTWITTAIILAIIVPVAGVSYCIYRKKRMRRKIQRDLRNNNVTTDGESVSGSELLKGAMKL